MKTKEKVFAFFGFVPISTFNRQVDEARKWYNKWDQERRDMNHLMRRSQKEEDYFEFPAKAGQRVPWSNVESLAEQLGVKYDSRTQLVAFLNSMGAMAPGEDKEEESVLQVVMDQLGLNYEEFLELRYHLEAMSTRAKAGKNKEYLKQAALALDLIATDN